MPGNKMEMRVVEWKMEGSLKYRANWRERKIETAGERERRARRGTGEDVTHADKRGKRQKETDCRQNFTAVRATIPHSHPTAQNNGRRMRLLFHF